MKPWLVLLLLALPTAAHARDLSSFHPIAGFHTPALRAGQYLLALTPRYSRLPYEYASSSGYVQGLDYQAVAGNRREGPTGSSFGVTFGSLYGFSDRTTLSLAVDFLPSQPALDGSGRSWSLSPSSSTVQDDAYGGRSGQLNAEMTLSYRPRENVELAVGGGYARATDRADVVSRGTTSISAGPTVEITRFSEGSGRNSFLDVWMSLVVIGD